MDRKKALLTAYALIGIATFGHSAGVAQTDADLRAERCRAQIPGSSFVCEPDKLSPPLGGILAGAFWPLYWSWEAFA